MKLQINTTSNKRHISQHWTDTTSNPVTDTARHNFIYNTDTTASLKGRRIIENICEAVIPQEKKTPSLHYHTAQKLHGHTFSTVNPRAIFTNTATCCGSGNVPALSGLAGMSLRQAAGPLCLSVSVGTDMLTSDRTDSWQEGVFFCFLLVHLQSISERVLSALACLLVDRMVCLTPERGWNKQMVQVKENRFSHWDQHSVREVGEVSSNHISESFATNMTLICRKKHLEKQNSETLRRTESCFLHWNFASSHYHASQRLLVCNKLHCLQSIASRVFSFIVAKTVLLLSVGEKHNGLLKRRWYHLFGCHIDVMLRPVGIIMSMERIKMRGRGDGNFHFSRAQLLPFIAELL